MADSYPTGTKCDRCGASLDCIVGPATCGDCADRMCFDSFLARLPTIPASDLISIVGKDQSHHLGPRVYTSDDRERYGAAARSELLGRLTASPCSMKASGIKAELGEYLNDHAVSVDWDDPHTCKVAVVTLCSDRVNEAIGRFDDWDVAERTAKRVRHVLQEMLDGYHAHLVDLGKIRDD